MNQIHVRVHDYKTEITEKHTADFFFIVIMSVKSRKKEDWEKGKEEKERGEELKIQQGQCLKDKL